jgi:hypothetical protein
MTSTSADRVALILDCLGHEDTELGGQARLWRHRYVTEDEAAIINESTLGDIRRAMDLWDEELKLQDERNRLLTEFVGLISLYAAKSELIQDAIGRMPEYAANRAEEILEQVGPAMEAWLQDQS